MLGTSRYNNVSGSYLYLVQKSDVFVTTGMKIKILVINLMIYSNQSITNRNIISGFSFLFQLINFYSDNHRRFLIASKIYQEMVLKWILFASFYTITYMYRNMALYIYIPLKAILRYVFRWEAGSSFPPVICKRGHVLFTFLV